MVQTLLYSTVHTMLRSTIIFALSGWRNKTSVSRVCTANNKIPRHICWCHFEHPKGTILPLSHNTYSTWSQYQTLLPLWTGRDAPQSTPKHWSWHLGKVPNHLMRTYVELTGRCELPVPMSEFQCILESWSALYLYHLKLVGSVTCSSAH